MNRFFSKIGRLSAVAIGLVAIGGTAFALPLTIDGQPCGSLSKVRGDTGGSVWAIEGCEPLSALMGQPTPTPTPVSSLCGNGLIDAGEVCDKLDPYTCGGKGSNACINNCTSCSGSTQPTPTPKPTATPGYNPECANGYLPPFAQPGFPGWLGIRKVSTDPGETQVFCADLDWDTTSFTMRVVDFTGAWQCFYHMAEFIPPAGSGLASKSTKSPAIFSTLSFRNSNGVLLPKGTWKLKIAASPDYPDCPMAYQLTAN